MLKNLIGIVKQSILLVKINKLIMSEVNMKKRMALQNVEPGTIDLGLVEMKACVPVLEEIDDYSVEVGLYKLSQDVPTPKYATHRSACFDIPVYMGSNIVYIDTYNRLLMHSVKSVYNLPERDNVRGINLEPGECGIIPTLLIFDIP